MPRRARSPGSCAPARSRHMEPEPQVLAPGGHLPQHVVSLGAGLAQFEIRRAHLVRGRGARDQAEQGEQQAPQGHGAVAPRFGISAAASRPSTVTV